MGARVLITGANSFTARHLISALGTLPDGLHPAGTDMGPTGPAGVVYHSADLTEPAAVDRVVAESRPHLIYHLAGISTGDRDRALAVNREGTRHLLAAAARLDPAPTVLVVSSAAVYGKIRPEDNPVTEETPLRPIGPYGESKAAAEALAREAHQAGTLGIIVVRPFNLIGPGLPRGLAPADFAAEAIRVRRGEGDPSIRVGALTPRRDFVDVRDAARAYVLLAACPAARGRVFNVGTGRPTSVGDLLEAILKAVGIRPQIETDPARLRPVDVETMVADTRALRELTGWIPQVPLVDSVRDLVAGESG